MALLKKAGMFRVSVPQEVGGNPMPPAQFLKMVEQVSEVGPATGWVASFGSASGYFASLPIESQRALYSKSKDIVFAAGMFPMFEAEKVDGGYLVTGEWQFDSGCKGADLLGMGLKGGPETEGKPLTALVDSNAVDNIAYRDFVVRRSTCSHTVHSDLVLVPEELTCVRRGQPSIEEPITRYPCIAYAAQVLSAVTLGAARGALDFMIEKGAASTSI